jgi:hypothetical protein
MVKTKMVSDMAKSEKSMEKSEKPDMKKLLENVKKGMVDLTSLKFSTIVGVGMDEETHAQKVTLELVERNAIPDSMDLLGIYEVLADGPGTIRSFRRVGMRKRSDAATSEEY